MITRRIVGHRRRGGAYPGRVAGGEDEMEAGSLVIDDMGLYGSRFMATEDGFAVEEMALTDQGLEDVLVTGVPDEENEE